MIPVHVKATRGMGRQSSIIVGFFDQITNATTPPLQESNCPSLKIILDKAKILRDAVTHPKPEASDTTANVVGREEALINLSFSDLEEAVDSAITLVQQIATTIGYSASRMSWLNSRTPSGVFADFVFD